MTQVAFSYRNSVTVYSRWNVGVALITEILLRRIVTKIHGFLEVIDFRKTMGLKSIHFVRRISFLRL